MRAEGGGAWERESAKGGETLLCSSRFGRPDWLWLAGEERDCALLVSLILAYWETKAMQPRFRSASSRFGLRPILFKDISLPHASMGCLLSLRAGGEAGRRFAAPAGGETALRSSHIGCEAETKAMQPRFRSASSRFGLRPILYPKSSQICASTICLFLW